MNIYEFSEGYDTVIIAARSVAEAKELLESTRSAYSKENDYWNPEEVECEVLFAKGFPPGVIAEYAL